MTISDLFENAELALAAFATLKDRNLASQTVALEDAGLTASQIPSLSSRFELVTQFNDTLAEGGMSTGFSVTVFKDLAGNLTVAFRGVDKLIPGTQSDLATALDIQGSGAAYDQIVAMANWWARASAPQGQMAQQFRLASYAPEAVPADAVVLRPDGVQVLVLEAAPAVEATGTLFDALSNDPDQRVGVTGQSLGGHLSLAFSSLFAARTGQVTVFNTPGFIDNDVNRAFFAKLGGLIPTGPIPTGSIVNVAADEALVDSTPFNWIAGMNSRPGEQINIAIENQFTNSDEPVPFSALNHSIVALADSLAAYKLLADLDPALTRANYKVILNQAVRGTAAGYERIVDTLESLLGVNDTLLPAGNNKREDMYQAITNLRLNPQYDSRIGLLQIKPTPDVATTLLTQAQDATAGLAYRFALRELNPLVAIDVGNTGLYARFQSGGANAGELDLYDSTTEQGRNGLTVSYLQDRAAFLERKLYITALNLTSYYETPNVSDPNSWPNAVESRGVAYQSEAKDFQDRASGFIASDGSPNPNSQQHFIFGGAGADVISGAARDDRLYGGAGDDVITGGGAADYLEGGAGFDTYRFSTSDGADTLLDADGRGVLVRNGAVLALAVKQSDTQWSSGATLFTKTADGKDLEVTFSGSEDKITIKDFNFASAQQGGYLAIRLVDASTAATGPARTFFGDKQNWDSDPNQEGIQAQDDGLGNPLRADGQGGRPDLAEADRADLFYGAENTEVERFLTEGGEDTVNADGQFSALSTAGGRDLIETGAGRDIVAAGAGEDWVEGGPEADILGGNAGNDALYADTTGGQTLTIALAITTGETEARSLDAGELLTGDAGQDMLFGAATDDLLLGGEGEDIVIGGGGDDTFYGDWRVTTADRSWAIQRTVTVQGGVTRYEVTGQNNIVFSEPSAGLGAADAIYAGAGADWIFAGAGDDYIDTGSDNDVAFGEAGSDVLIGGAGDDVLSGDNAILVFGTDEGADYLDGGAGEDILNGDGDDDILYGGADDDYLGGGARADILAGGLGQDLLVGGAGKDTYIFYRGDGREDIFDPSSGADDPDASVLALGEGITAADITLQLGSLAIDLGNGDSIHFEGFDALDPFSTPLLDSIQFADGTAMSYQEVLDLGFDIDGTEGDDVIDGTAVPDRIDAKGGNDNVSGRTGDDNLLGAAGPFAMRFRPFRAVLKPYKVADLICDVVSAKLIAREIGAAKRRSLCN